MIVLGASMILRPRHLRAGRVLSHRRAVHRHGRVRDRPLLQHRRHRHPLPLRPDRGHSQHARGCSASAHPTGALTVLPIILGFYIIIDSVFSIQAAVELRRFGLGSWGLNLLLGIVGAVLGVLMILDPFDGAAALMIYMGVSLLLAGVESIYTVICLSRAFKSDAHQRVIDAVWHEV